MAVKIEGVHTADRGFTMIMPGFGFLRDVITAPYLVHWEMSRGFAMSEQLPGVRIPGAAFIGVMRVAPSHELAGADRRARRRVVGPRRHGTPDAASAVLADAGIAARRRKDATCSLIQALFHRT